MSLPIIFMYSGQGSQYYQMGRNLFDGNIVFKNSMIKADQIYQEMTGSSILARLYDDQFKVNQPFTQTTLTHPAIFMVEHALTQVFLAQNIVPDMVLGTSLGEFAAAATAGIISFESALDAVIKQADNLAVCPPGGMLAVLHNPDLFTSQSYFYNHSELAAISFNSHFVVAGSNENLQLITNKLNESRIPCQLLPVSHAFHSNHIDTAKEPFLQSIKELVINKGNIPCVSCEQGGLLDLPTLVHFWDVVRQPILFQKTITQLEHKQSGIYIDLGPSGTLANFVKYNLSSGSQSNQFPIITPYGNEANNLDKVLNFLNAK